MQINNLIKIIESKLEVNFKIDSVTIEDKSFLHTKHNFFDKKKFHIKLTISSPDFKNIDKVTANRKIYKILENEIKKNIHSLQIIII